MLYKERGHCNWIPPSLQIFSEETFGPAVPLFKVTFANEQHRGVCLQSCW